MHSSIAGYRSLAAKWGWRADNPAKGIERYHEERRERWLSDTELAGLLKALAEHPNQRAANAVRFQLLTGARIGEVLSASWSEIDLTRRVWTKPSHHTKQKRTEHLPLSAPAMAQLADMRASAPSGTVYLFPGDAPDKPLQDIKKFWRRLTDRQGFPTTGCTTIAIPMPRTSCPAVSAWRLSAGYSAIQTP